MAEVNIVIPTYNEEDNIIRLLHAIIKNKPNSKIIIIDDSSKNKIGLI